MESAARHCEADREVDGIVGAATAASCAVGEGKRTGIGSERCRHVDAVVTAAANTTRSANRNPRCGIEGCALQIDPIIGAVCSRAANSSQSDRSRRTGTQRGLIDGDSVVAGDG